MSFLSAQLRQSVLAALADREIVKILDCALVRERSVNEVIRECNIPHTTAYRKIKWLVEQDLLVVDRICITDEGKKYSLFHSVFRSIVVKYENIKIIIEAEQNIDPVENVTGKLLSLH